MPKAAVAPVVYVVDADESVRLGLARVVDSAGLEAKPFDSTEAFVRQAPGGHKACALVDVSNLLRCEPGPWSRLRAIAAAIPVIALSARDDAATRRMARELGAQAFFRKPVDAAALLDSIDWVTRTEARGEADR
jgi:FixJ family two-component response regulator